MTTCEENPPSTDETTIQRFFVETWILHLRSQRVRSRQSITQITTISVQAGKVKITARDDKNFLKLYSSKDFKSRRHRLLMTANLCPQPHKRLLQQISQIPL